MESNNTPFKYTREVVWPLIGGLMLWGVTFFFAVGYWGDSPLPDTLNLIAAVLFFITGVLVLSMRSSIEISEDRTTLSEIRSVLSVPYSRTQHAIHYGRVLLECQARTGEDGPYEVYVLKLSSLKSIYEIESTMDYVRIKALAVQLATVLQLPLHEEKISIDQKL